MLTLSAALLSAQKFTTRKDPVWKVVLSRSSQTTRGYKGSKTASTVRVLKISHVEMPRGDTCELVLNNHDGALTSLDFEHYQAVISQGYDTGATRSAWAVGTVYAIDDIRRPTTANGYQYRCSVAGTSHASTEPTWPTDLGVTVADNTVTWEMDGNAGEEYGRRPPLRVRAQEFYSGRGLLRCILRPAGILDQLDEDKAIAKYTQESTDTNTVKTLISAVAAASTGLSSAFNGYTVYTVVYDSEDTIIDSFIPADYFQINVNETRLAKIEELLAYTGCKMRIGNDGKIHIFDPTTTGTTYDYEYKFNVSGDHNFWAKSVRLRFVNPNKETVASHLSHTVQYSGSATSATSNALTPKVHTTYRRLVSNAQGNSIAAAIIEQYELDAEKGFATVPMNVGQELWDYVKITDSRENDTRIGNIQYIQRDVEVHLDGRPLTWTMMLSFGKVSSLSLMANMQAVGGISAEGRAAELSTEQILGLFDLIIDKLESLLERPKAKPANLANDMLPYQLDKAILPIVIDTTFTATDNDDISWLAGTITFADKTTQAIDVGSLNLANANAYYLYAIVGNTTLQNTQTFGTAVATDRVLIAFAKKAPQTNQKAMIVPAPGGKAPLLNEDNISASSITSSEIYVSQLSAIAADMGILTSGEIRVGTGTVGSNFTGFRLTSSYIAGYNTDVLQAYIQASDGKLYAGAGAVVIDASGILIKESGAGNYLQLYWSGAGAGTVGYVRARANNEFAISAAVDIHLILEASGAGKIRALEDILPYTNEGEDLGSLATHWSLTVTKDLYLTQDGVDFGTIYADLDGSIILLPDATGGNVEILSGNLKMYTTQKFGLIGAGADGVLYFADSAGVRSHKFSPETSANNSLGDSTHLWGNIYGSNIRATQLHTTAALAMANDGTHKSGDIGTAAQAFGIVHCDDVTFYSPRRVDEALEKLKAIKFKVDGGLDYASIADDFSRPNEGISASQMLSTILSAVQELAARVGA